MKRQMALDETLEAELRTVWNNDDFVLGVMTNAGAGEGRETVLAFIEKAHELGDDITSDDLLLLSVAIAERRDPQQRKE